jgi:hypothetical protein
VAALAAAAPAAAVADDDLDLLRRHAPVLHYDARERDRATAVEALVDLPLRGAAVSLRATPRDAPDVAYGRSVAGRDGSVWLQYWFLYADNEQDRGIVRTGRHEGDWEMVQVRLGRDGRPREATYAQHKWAARCDWTGHVYVANGSHASYPDRGEHGRPWPDPDDEARGDGRVVRPEVRSFGTWVGWPGRWGRAEAAWWNPAEAPSPEGPAFQEDGAWRDPSARHAEARACSAGAPPHPWPVYAAAVVGAFAVLAGLVLVARRTLAP